MSATALARWGDVVRAAAPSVELVQMRHDGTIVAADGSPLPGDPAEGLGIEAAWGSNDLFMEGGPARPFFGFATRSPAMRWFQTSAAGTDLPFFGRLLGNDVRVCTAHVQSVAIAEFVLRSVLDVFQDADGLRRRQADRAWAATPFREVAGSTWLVVGMGAIGSDVALRAAAFGAHVIGVRRRPRGSEPCARVITPAELQDALPGADVVVLAAPATPDTVRLVDAAFLAAMRPDAVLVNVARGALVDEDALLAALDAGAIGAAVLDVVAKEPLPADHPFWGHPRVVLTSHTSWNGSGTARRAAELFARNLAAFVAGRPLEHEITLADLPAGDGGNGRNGGNGGSGA